MLTFTGNKTLYLSVTTVPYENATTKIFNCSLLAKQSIVHRHCAVGIVVGLKVLHITNHF